MSDFPELSLDDVEALAVGAWILGTGGDGRRGTDCGTDTWMVLRGRRGMFTGRDARFCFIRNDAQCMRRRWAWPESASSVTTSAAARSIQAGAACRRAIASTMGVALGEADIRKTTEIVRQTER
jgi:hypothetical protein